MCSELLSGRGAFVSRWSLMQSPASAFVWVPSWEPGSDPRVLASGTLPSVGPPRTSLPTVSRGPLEARPLEVGPPPVAGVLHSARRPAWRLSESSAVGSPTSPRSARRLPQRTGADGAAKARLGEERRLPRRWRERPCLSRFIHDAKVATRCLWHRGSKGHSCPPRLTSWLDHVGSHAREQRPQDARKPPCSGSRA